jgi:hypothetical protein
MKITTHGQVGLAWFEDKQESLDFNISQPIWQGNRDKIPHKVAEKVATIHPNYLKYYEYAIMPLYKAFGQGGTENPVMALLDKVPEKYQYVIIYNIREEE